MPEQYRKTELYKAQPETRRKEEIEKLTPEMKKRLNKVERIAHDDPSAICTKPGWTNWMRLRALSTGEALR